MSPMDGNHYLGWRKPKEPFLPKDEPVNEGILSLFYGALRAMKLLVPSQLAHSPFHVVLIPVIYSSFILFPSSLSFLLFSIFLVSTYHIPALPLQLIVLLFKSYTQNSVSPPGTER